MKAQKYNNYGRYAAYETKIDKKTRSSDTTVKLEVYLKNRYEFRYNTLTDETEIRPLKKRNTLFTPVTQQLLNSICMDAIAAAEKPDADVYCEFAESIRNAGMCIRRWG